MGTRVATSARGVAGVEIRVGAGVAVGVGAGIVPAPAHAMTRISAARPLNFTSLFLTIVFTQTGAGNNFSRISSGGPRGIRTHNLQIQSCKKTAPVGPLSVDLQKISKTVASLCRPGRSSLARPPAPAREPAFRTGSARFGEVTFTIEHRFRIVDQRTRLEYQSTRSSN